MAIIQLLLFFSISSFWAASWVEGSAITYVWENALIPYDVSRYEQRDRDMFLRATKYIQDRTCVRFRPKSNGDKCFLNMVYGGCCGTHGGRQPWCNGKDGQDLTMSKGLGLPFYLHELGHTLGFPHEQDRWDRDEYIYWDNNKPGCSGGNFAGRANNLDQAALDITFDFVSLMADWTECYWPQPFIPVPKNIPLGPGGSDDRTYSVLDIERINAVYSCKNCYGYRFRKIKQLAANQNPLVAGYEFGGGLFYICRGYHEGHLVIGKFVPGAGNDRCWLAFENEKEYKENFEVLTLPHGGNFRWAKRPDNSAIPSNAVKGGRTKDRETLYIGRCLVTNGHGKSLIPGFVLESNGREIRIPLDWKAQRCTDFEYLVCDN